MYDKRKKITAKEVRHILFVTEKQLRKRKGHNKLHQKYLSKIQYMLMHLRMFPLTKDVMDNWSMPDYNNIWKLKKKSIT